MVRNIVLVLGDQLDDTSAAFDGFATGHDVVVQIEAREEATYVPQHKLRLAFFFAAMRQFSEMQRAKGRRVHYSQLEHPENRGSLAAELLRWQGKIGAERIIMLAPGDWRVEQTLRSLPLPIEIRPDGHFLCSREEFNAFADEHPRLLLETFYRHMRRKLNVLIGNDGAPRGGAWNYDKDNRHALPRRSGPAIPRPKAFPPDEVTRDVMTMVQRVFPNAPGRLDEFDLPVTRDQALAALRNFIQARLLSFGRYQDAMRDAEPYLFHSVLSGPLNLHLLRPREVVDAAIAADVPLAAAEGFARQIIGWREFVHGIYWRHMPGYAKGNALAADLPMPRFYWTGDTDMRCLSQAIQHTIDHAYAHHIERLMVLGLFALLLGVRPYDVHRWHMSMFRDAVDWVSLPNALGMSQYADGGIVGTKPYAASGNYINRMSDHCSRCRYSPEKSTGDNACPFTTLYWDFLSRHRQKLSGNRRMRPQYLNLERKEVGELQAIRKRADTLKATFTAQTFL